MSFTVTQRKRGGFEYTSVAETEAAALVLATMMRRAGDEYCAEASVTVRNRAGAAVAKVGPIRENADGADGVGVAGVDGASVVRVHLHYRLFRRLRRLAPLS